MLSSPRPVVMSEDRALQGYVAIVTGAASGIGQAIVQMLSELGVVVHALVRASSKPQISGALIHWHQVDLGDDQAIEAFVAQWIADARGLDLLVHSAGLFCAAPVSEASIADLDRVWQVNARAPYLLTQQLLPALIQQKGYVAFVNSSVWTGPRRDLSAYSMSKFALKGFADTLRAEMHGHGVRVVSVFPGKVATAMQKQIHHGREAVYRPEFLLDPMSVASALINIFRASRDCEITDLFLRPTQSLPEQ